MHPVISDSPCWGFRPAPYSSDKAHYLEYPWRRQPDSSLLGPKGWCITADGWAIAGNGKSIGPSGTIVELATRLKTLPVDNPGYVDPKRWWIQADGSAIREDGWVIGSDGQASCTSGEILNPDEGTLDTEIFNETEASSDFFKHITEQMKRTGTCSLVKICHIKKPVMGQTQKRTSSGKLFVGNIPTDVKRTQLLGLFRSLLGGVSQEAVTIKWGSKCTFIDGFVLEEIEWLQGCFNHRILLDPKCPTEYAVFTGANPATTLAALIDNTRNFFDYYPKNPLVIEQSTTRATVINDSDEERPS